MSASLLFHGFGIRGYQYHEISIGRRNKYLTVVMDLRSGAVVFVGKGRRSDALVPFWKRLRRAV